MAAGAGLVAVFLVLEVVGDPGEPAWAGVLWMLGFFAFLAGIALFAVGSVIAKSFPPGAPLLVLVGPLAAMAIDMASDAFFDDDSSTTESGFYIGVPLFGLGLAWMGSPPRAPLVRDLRPGTERRRVVPVRITRP